MTISMRRVLLACIFLQVLKSGLTQEICNIFCDGREASLAVNTRIPVSVELFGRQFQLYITDDDNMGFGEVIDGNPGDVLWVDRSMDGGFTWDGSLGNTTIPLGTRSVRTKMYNVDNPDARGIGALRACGKAGDRPDIVCTAWARSDVGASTQTDAGATALMQLFNGQLWPTAGWWNGANCLTAMIDYLDMSGNPTYRYVIDEVYEKNKEREDGNFTNYYIDDTLWWGLAWVRAYDVTGDRKYLNMAQIDSDYCYEYKDSVCGGGLWWTTSKDYKNAIPNELFIKLAAALHNRIPGDSKYLAQSVEVWEWFRASGMINNDNLINDGLNDQCRNNGLVTWSYNQGVILGGLVELNRATGDEKYLREARAIADAVLNCSSLNPCPQGILYEYGCEGGGGDCGGDAPSFKGIFVRNLGELDRHLGSIGQGRPYLQWLETQADSIWSRNRNSLNQFGVHWSGPYDRTNAANQHSAFETFIAANWVQIGKMG